MPTRPFSVEAVIVGRNDNYEPNWETNLFAAIAYNRALFENTNVDYRVAFVEWNPLPSRPLLAPRLTDRFPFVRGIVVDSAIHHQLCEVPELPILLTFAFNAGFRTTAADFCLGTCGDIFLGTTLVRKIGQGLRAGCLYRAERVNIKSDLQFDEAASAVIESPENIVSVDSCSEAPYDAPPYTNAAGDFSMLDVATMRGIRGYDEDITFARLHIDARFGLTAMTVVNDCELLGRIFHVSHVRSHSNPSSKAPGRSYDYTENLPYANLESWGLADYDWIKTGDRVYTVRIPAMEYAHSAPLNVPESTKAVAALVTRRLNRVRSERQPGIAVAAIAESDLFGNMVSPSPDWNSVVRKNGGSIELETGPAQWGYSCMFRLGDSVDASRNCWAAVNLEVSRGAVGVGLLENQRFVTERFINDQNGRTDVVLPLERATADSLIVRNAAEGGMRSAATIHSVKVISRVRDVEDEKYQHPANLPAKLHLGCGKRYLPGFVHVDRVAFPHIDYVQDIARLPQFPDRSIEVIYASQVLTYFDREEVVPVLAEWRRALAPGGILRLSVPNFETVTTLYAAGLRLEWFLGTLYGRMSDGKGSYIYERTTYEEASIQRGLETAGFEGIERWDWRETEHAEYDDFSQAYFPHMEKDRGILMNLNVQARRTL